MPVIFMLAIILTLCAAPAPCWAGRHATPNMMGALGLNTVPSARMDAPGTVRLHGGGLAPYLHASAGIQLAEPLYIAIRQSAQSTDLTGDPDRLYPGIDLRLRLAKETAVTPEITLGLQSAIGHKRMGAEYLAFSKRYERFDFTGGIAWGRLGSAAHIDNPLKVLGGHFGKRRAFDQEMPNGPEDWFTGEDVGFFAGLEYFTPLDGLSLKADWGADRYSKEKQIFAYDPPDPWSVGVNFSPADWISIGGAVVGGEKLLASLSLQSPAEDWIGRSYRKHKAPYMRPYRTGLGLPQEMALAAQRDDIQLYEMRGDLYNAEGKLLLDPQRPMPLQIGHAARHMANHAGEVVETLGITPLSYGLEGHEITLLRRDLEQAVTRQQGSPQEIWRNVSFDPGAEGKGFWHDRFNIYDSHRLRLILDNQVSLSEEDSGLLYRTGLILEEERKLAEHIWAGGSLRLDLKDNLHHLNTYRPAAILPVRSNVDAFAQRTLSLDRSFLSWMTTLKPDLHVSLKGGLLEEMYAGAGGEVLYRPFGKTFAIGAEAWQVFKRDPYAFLNLGLNGDHLMTGHIQGWYEFPNSDVTLHARIGRYLAEDFGGTLALSRQFENGAKMEAFVTATNAGDFDVFGGLTHLYSGVKLRLPFGHVKHIPEGSEIRLTAAPLGRDAGQALDTPMPLYEISEPLSYRHITRHWNDVVE
ncbi:MAG: YjbH domain-containing protein [Rhodospirillales bacterium]|nr:YjbH domain-containing protein [Rhodospirillales bacterium]MCB9995004.1 YjbH domain-containing protein [Rhodospirillales bacterium]